MATTGSPKTSPHSAKPPIGGEDHGALFVAGVDELEEQIAATGNDRQVADFVDDEQCKSAEEPDLLAQGAFTFGLGERADEVGERGEVDAATGFDGFDAERQAEMALAGAGRSSDILPGIRATRADSLSVSPAMWGDRGCRSASAFPTWRRLCRPSTRWNAGAYSMLDDERGCGSS